MFGKWGDLTTTTTTTASLFAEANPKMISCNGNEGREKQLTGTYGVLHLMPSLGQGAWVYTVHETCYTS